MQLNRTVDLMEGRLAVKVGDNKILLERNYKCMQHIEQLVEKIHLVDGAQKGLSLQGGSSSMPQSQLSALGESLFRCLEAF